MLEPQTIIMSRTDKIGDFIVSIPSFATLKAMYPETRLIALVSNSNEVLAQHISCIDATINVDALSDEQIIESVRQEAPDVFIALVTNKRIGYLARQSKAKKKIGPLSKLHSFFSYPQGKRQSRSKSIKSEAEYNLDLVRSIDPQRFDEVGIQFARIQYSAKESAMAEQLLKEQAIEKDNFLLINPFTGGSGRNLKSEDYSAFIGAFLKESLQHHTREIPKVVLFGMPDHKVALEEMQHRVDKDYRDQVVVITNPYSLLVAAALVDACRVYIGPSTGISQIAGNYQKKALCFYSSMKSNCYTRWQLFGDKDNYGCVLEEENIDKASKQLLSFTEELCHEIVVWAQEAYFEEKKMHTFMHIVGNKSYKYEEK